jgi:phage FluMu protein gp41
MYTDNFRTEQYYSEELIDIYIFEMYVRKRMLDLAEQIINSKEPEVIAMQSGRPAIVRGYVNVITNLIRQQEKTKAFSVRQLKKLNKEVANSILENVKYLDTQSKQDISSEINRFNDKSKEGYLGKDFANVLKALKD